MRSCLIFLFVSLLLFCPVYAHEIIFENHYSDGLKNESRIFLNDSSGSAAAWITFYFKNGSDEGDITNITFYLPGEITFTGENETSVDDASFDINDTNNSIATWYPTHYPTNDGIDVSSEHYDVFKMEVNVPSNIEMEWKFSINITWSNKSWVKKEYPIFVDTIPPRIVNFSFISRKGYYNISSQPRVNISVYDTYLRNSTQVYVVFKNSSKMNYYNDNTSFIVHSFEFPGGFKNFTYDILMKRYILKDKNINEVYNAAYMIIHEIRSDKNYTYLAFPVNVTNTSTSSYTYFTGTIFFNITSSLDFLYLKDEDAERYINESGIYYENGTPIIKDSNQLNNLYVNVSYFTFLKGKRWIINYTDTSFSMRYFLENISFVLVPLYDANYSLVLETKDMFHHNFSEIFFEVNNTPFDDFRKLNLNVVNGTEILAKPYTYEFYLNTTSENATCYVYFNYSTNPSPVVTLHNLSSGTHTFITQQNPSMYIINLTCIDAFGKSKSDFANISVVDEPDLKLKFINVTPKAYKVGDNVKIYYNISNRGSKDASDVNITFKVCSDASCSDILFSNYSDPTILLNAEDHKVNYFNYTLTNTNKIYIKMGAYASERDFDYSNQNLSFDIYPALVLDINVSGTTTDLKPGTNLTLYVGVKHHDGISYTSLTKNDFVIYDYWHYTEKYTNRSNNLFLITTFENGTYKFKYEIPNFVDNKYYEFGDHKFIIGIVSKYFKHVNASYKEYNIQAPFIELSMSAPSSLTKGDSGTVKVTAKNIGDITVNHAKITIKVSDGLSITSSSTCYLDAISTDESKECQFTIKGSDVGDEKVYVRSSIDDSYFNVTGDYASKIGFYSYPSKTITVKKQEEQEQQQQDTSSNSDSSSTTSTNSNSSSQNTSTHKIRKPSLSLSLTNSKISFLINSSSSLDVTIKNVGNGSAKNLALVLEYDKVNLDIASNFNRSSLDPGKEYTFSLNISSPTHRVGEYVLGITVKYGSNESVYKDLTIDVLPTEKKKQEIKQLLDSLKNDIKRLKVSENLKAVYNQTQSLLNDAENKISKGDYVGAYSLLEKAQKNMEVMKKSAEVKKSSSRWWIWIIIVVIMLCLVGGLLYYLLTPPKSTFNPEKGYSFNPQVYEQQRANYIRKLKESLQRKLS